MQETNIDSMLNADLSGVDTDFPVLQAGVVSCIIAECALGESKEKKTPGIIMKLTTTQPTVTTSGVTKSAGFPIRHTIWLNASEKFDPKQNLAQLKLAVFGTKEGAFGDPSLYVGKPVVVRLAIEASEEYGNQNRVKAFVKAA